MVSHNALLTCLDRGPMFAVAGNCVIQVKLARVGLPMKALGQEATGYASWFIAGLAAIGLALGGGSPHALSLTTLLAAYDIDCDTILLLKNWLRHRPVSWFGRTDTLRLDNMTTLEFQTSIRTAMGVPGSTKRCSSQMASTWISSKVSKAENLNAYVRRLLINHYLSTVRKKRLDTTPYPEGGLENTGPDDADVSAAR